MTRHGIESSPSRKLGRVDKLPPVQPLRVWDERGMRKHLFETPGGRKITVALLTDKTAFGELQASTYIDASREHTRTPGSTNALYTEAKELMQQTADTRGEVLTYTFRTYSPAMTNWALTQGRKLFNWQDVYEPAPYEELVLHSRISPKK